ncbi:RNA polymerase sigma factor [Thermodesulfobacteriota bacterium]
MNTHKSNKSNSSEEDTALVRDFQSGNRAAFDKLVLRHKDRVFSLCYRFFGDYQEAEDIAQDVFLKVYNSLRSFRFKSSFYTWIYRVAVNTCKNRAKSSEYRNMKMNVQLNNNPRNQDEVNQSIQTGGKQQTPLDDLEKEERTRLIQKAIDSLPTEQKAVIILRDIKGLSYKEMADITGNQLGTLKSRLSRARLGLKKQLGGLI